jgi:hypothetical protein
MQLSHIFQDSPVHSLITPFPTRSLLFGISIRVRVRGCTSFLNDLERRVDVASYNHRMLYSVEIRSSKNDHDDRVSSQEPASVGCQHGMADVDKVWVRTSC